MCAQELAVLLVGVDDKGKVVLYVGVPDAVQARGLAALDWLRAALPAVSGKGGGKGAMVTGQVRFLLKVKWKPLLSALGTWRRDRHSFQALSALSREFCSLRCCFELASSSL